MGYRHINNLYKDQTILMFNECWASEKIHGSSAHISWKELRLEDQVCLYCGGCKATLFEDIFDKKDLKKRFEETGLSEVVIYGEGYGGKMQGMSKTYGTELKFVAFEVKIGETWLSVPDAHEFCENFGIEFVAYEKVSTKLEDLDRERDKPCRQAKRNGILEDKISEGVVLRPITEMVDHRGNRVMCKHKRDEFMETSKPRKVQDPAKLKVLADALEIAKEWVTINRLNNVLSKIDIVSMENMSNIIKAMIEDVKREGEGEIIWSDAVGRQIGKRTANMVKEYFQNKLKGL
jgi:Rnl2 family RNA ligase